LNRSFYAKAKVKSFRDKNDPYLNMTSRFELQKDAQDRNDMNYEVLLNKVSVRVNP